MENSIEDKVVFWLINRRLMGYVTINFYDCAKDIGINPINQNNIKKINRIFEWYYNKIDQYIINYFEENN